MFCRMSASAAAKPEVKEKPMDREMKPSKSFVHNMFLGRSETEQLLPYPNYLTPEHVETLEMLIDPGEKFFSVSSSLTVPRARRALYCTTCTVLYHVVHCTVPRITTLSVMMAHQH